MPEIAGIPTEAVVAELFETIRIGNGRIVSLKPKPAVMPLIAVTIADAQTKGWRSRPGSVAEICTLATVRIVGVDELVSMA